MPLTPKQQPPYYTPQQPIKQYKALITQSGTNPPTAVELINTLGTVTWGYDSTGTYRITKTGAFPPDKTYIDVTNPGYYIVGGGRNNNDSCYISSWLHDGTTSNDVFIEQGILIEVYP